MTGFSRVKMLRKISTPLIFFLHVSVVYSAKFPENWTKCPKTGDNEECLKKAIQEAVISLKDGSKPLSLIPIDPLHFDRMNIQQGGSSPVSINLTFFDVDVSGASTLTVTKAKVDWEKYQINVTFTVKEPLLVLGDYAVSGKVLVLPIQGEGKANITLDGFVGTAFLDGNEIMKGSKKYFDVNKGAFKLDAKECHIWLGNLFNGVPNLGDNMNKFLNENWKEILDELTTPVSNVLGQVVQQIANVFFHKVPIDQVYTT